MGIERVEAEKIIMERYLITGVTGYIGSLLAKRIIQSGQKVSVIVWNPSRLDNVIMSNAEVIQADIRDREAIYSITEKYDYIIHCAAPTKSAYMMTNPVEVSDTIISGTKHILNLAERCNAGSVVYLSSMEVYGQISCQTEKRIAESEMGYIDVSNVRSCYPIAKIMAENLCHSYFAEYGVPVKIARLAQTFGRGIRTDDNRVFAQFANAVRTGSDIVLHTAGNSMGNYCDIDEVIDAILFLLQKGVNSEAYNVVNEKNTMRIREMAELVAKKVAGGSIKVSYDIPEGNRFGYAPDTGLKLSGEKLRRLGWEATCSLEDMYRKMLRDFESGSADS